MKGNEMNLNEMKRKEMKRKEMKGNEMEKSQIDNSRIQNHRRRIEKGQKKDRKRIGKKGEVKLIKENSAYRGSSP